MKDRKCYNKPNSTGGTIELAAQDIVAKVYMKDAEVFVDAFNYFLYNGRQVIDPLKLYSMDTAEIGTPYGTGRLEAPVQKFRDGLKYWIHEYL